MGERWCGGSLGKGERTIVRFERLGEWWFWLMVEGLERVGKEGGCAGNGGFAMGNIWGWN